MAKREKKEEICLVVKEKLHKMADYTRTINILFGSSIKTDPLNKANEAAPTQKRQNQMKRNPLKAGHIRENVIYPTALQRRVKGN